MLYGVPRQLYEIVVLPPLNTACEDFRISKLVVHPNVNSLERLEIIGIVIMNKLF